MAQGIKSAVPRRGIWGWMLFDWAAQPFFTLVTTFIFGPYFISRMASDPAAGQAAWGYGVAVAGLFIAVLSPDPWLDCRPDRPQEAVDRFLRGDPDRLTVDAVDRSAGVEPGAGAVLLLPGDAGGGVFDRLQRFHDAPSCLEGRYRARVEHRLGPRLSRRHDRADLLRAVPLRFGGNRQDAARRRSAVRPRSGAGRGRACHRSDLGCLVSRLHHADVAVHAGRRQGPAARTGRSRSDFRN